ncbi:hypothetical protein ACGFNU_32515 [Spirillospora sp. NPDC048911]|uniref:hypothetical protein n=1 Tax=Spirillospora sp. NPDC048911 TaxID=3364527 RepID=UPI00371F0A57
MTGLPAPSPEIVSAARTHLTSRFARGLDGVLWEEGKHPLTDTAAVAEVLAAARRGDELLGPDLAAALVVMQAIQLDGDRLEYELFMLARSRGLSFEQISAVLDLSGPEEAQARMHYLTGRAHQPVDPVTKPILGGPGVRPERAAKVGQRVEQIVRRSRQSGHRQRELAGGARPMFADDLDQAEHRLGHAKELTEEAHRQGTLAFLRAAEAHEKAAVALENAAALADAQAPDHAADLRRQADLHRARARHHRSQAEQHA